MTEVTKFVKYGLFVGTFVLGFSTFASADPGHGDGFDRHHGKGNSQQAPEIDPGLALGAVSLIGGSLLVQRARRSR